MPVDTRLLAEERGLGISGSDDHHERRTAQGGRDPVDPLGGDERVGTDEDGDGQHDDGGARRVLVSVGGLAGGESRGSEPRHLAAPRRAGGAR